MDDFLTNPKETAGFLSILFMTWLNNILKLGSQRTLDGDDLYPLLEEDEAQELVDTLENRWMEEMKKAEKTGKRPRLWKAVLKTLSMRDCILAITIKLLESFWKLMLAIMLFCYLEVISQGSHMDQNYAILSITGISVAVMIKVFSYHHSEYQTRLMGMRLKIALIGLVYRKVLFSSRSSIIKVTTGHIINLVSSDAQKMELAVSCLVYCLGTPYEIISSIILLCFLVGWESLLVLLFFLLLMIYNISMCKEITELRKEQAQTADKRLAAMTEIVSGIRAVKMYAWEWKYRDKIKEIRREEIKIVQKKTFILSTFLTFYLTTRPLAVLISITTLVHSGFHLSASAIFTLTTILDILNIAICGYLSEDFYIFAESKIALDRFEHFLLIGSGYDEHDVKITFIKGKSVKSLVTSQRSKLVKKTDIFTQLEDIIQPHLTLTDLSVGWSEDDGQCALRGISLRATGNQLVIVTGAVGSGKSSLFMAIQEEIPVKSGRMSVLGKVAYVTQIPWVFSGSVLENILFGKPFIEKRYKEVLEACDLQEDIRHFPKGDLSMIGERGVSLSGGQRARVSLARAVYSDADIFLLDDPLSAVDAKVGQHIFDKCICGELSGRLRILATHQLQHLHRADNIVVLSKGRVVGEGSYEDLIESGVLSEVVLDITEAKKVHKTTELRTVRLENSSNDPEIGESVSRDMMGDDEDRMVGTITWRLYWDYLRAGPPAILLIGLALLALMMQVSLLAPNWWLSRMAEMSHKEQKSATTLGIYGALAAAALVLSLLSISLFFFSVLKSSETLHDKMTVAVIESPVLFFDTNPAGRIMNRFSKDTGTMDDLLPYTTTKSLSMCLYFTGVVVLSAVANVWLLIAIIPLVVLFVYLGKYYLKTGRELKRLEAISCSPVYAHVVDTITGLEIIRCSHMENEFLDMHIRQQNENTKALFLVLFTNRWFGLYLDLLCGIFVIAVAIGSLVLAEQPGVAGMLLSFAIGVLGITQFGIRTGAEAESYMTSAERVITYSQLPSEPGYSRETLPPEDWPTEGAISVRDMSLVYLKDGPRVLQGINLDIQPKEKVGIAGRTGAGKSSLVAALFRMPDPQGQIFIDGIDLGTLNIQAARRAIAVITQDPVLFAGTLRKNLDPFNRFTDDDIWIALAEVQLGSTIAKLDGHLEYCVGESGSGFSVGERQLLCLARALLQRCKVLVMDEATANVDFKTDQLIQEVIRRKFSSCTVLTIAHRLNTIMDYDKVIVIDQGHVVEYDKPQVLAGKDDGVFARLLQSYASNSNV